MRNLRHSFAVVALLILASPAWAGSESDPEIQDAEGDQQLANGAPDSQGTFASADITAAWVGNQTQDALTLHLRTAQLIRGGSVEGQTTTTYTYRIMGQWGNQSLEAGASVVGNPPEVTPLGHASEASANDNHLMLVVPLSQFGAVHGTVLGQLYANSTVHLQATGVLMAGDRAPDADFGRDYVAGATEVVRDQQGPESQESPGTGMLAVLAVMALAVAVRRKAT